ncbi:hypothetical protein [Litoreibacter janthinus]|uniref:Uncharacterized protein n=1 Tax=Litoreibacter janthinus TaxID=670154 RepID=A0A1I6H2E5_9RHOB|nr:hypothetical protein [Litoreibacter janthinus]SFR48572.1 hypothetical protein SAMN04488002_2382 [Litoreibacter janthinus]
MARFIPLFGTALECGRCFWRLCSITGEIELRNAEGKFMVEAILLMGVLTALSAVFTSGKISHVRAHEFVEFMGSVAHRPMSVKS